MRKSIHIVVLSESPHNAESSKCLKFQEFGQNEQVQSEDPKKGMADWSHSRKSLDEHRSERLVECNIDYRQNRER